MPGLDLRGHKVGGSLYFSSFVAAPDFATVAPQKIYVPGGKKQYNRESLTGGKAPRRRDEAQARCGQKKRGKAGTSGASHAGKTTLQVYNTLQYWWVERGKTVERGTATLQAYNVLQCWWLVREIIPRKTNPAGVQRLAVLVVGQRRTTSCSVGGWSEGNAEKLRNFFQKLFHSMTTSRRQNRTQDALNGLSPRSSDRVAHRHISVTTRCVTTGDRPPSLQGVVRLQGSRSSTRLTIG
ncbi:hypothetical protein B0H14DRAFT_2562349 [Mycena olivaceomarginata]|nr:hypothetical protein B0H14DRAFT_2562349 [Mycena olivaceomarginata]